jgi:hypothetical protein
MEALILQAFMRVDIVGKEVHDGQFKGAEGHPEEARV